MTPDEYINSAKTTEERNFRKMQMFPYHYATSSKQLPPDSIEEVPAPEVLDRVKALMENLQK